MCKRTLKIREPSYATRAAKSFFILAAHDPLRVVGHVTVPELPSPLEVESGVVRRVVAPELSLAGERGLELGGACQHRSPSLQRDGIRS
jgi:hypothetical protein